MLLQEATPDTSAYMIAGYAVFSLIMAVYLASFFIRRRNLEQDLTTLQSMESEGRVREGKAAGALAPARVRKAGQATAGQRKSSRKKTSSKK
jgi:hypothetical protein